VPALPLVRVRLKYVDPDAFVERFAANVTRGGVFLASRDPKPVGALVRFEITLINGHSMLAGEGRVTWVKPFTPSEPNRPHGMGVQFTEIEPNTRPMFERLLERREAAGKRGAGPTGPGARPAPRPLPERRPSEPITTEFDSVEDTALRRALDRARSLGRVDDLDSLLQGEPDEPATRAQALEDLPRYLARRGSGLFRLPEPPGAGAAAATSAAPAEPGAQSTATPAVTADSPTPSPTADAEGEARLLPLSAEPTEEPRG
jgi:molecular chaperone DnaK